MDKPTKEVIFNEVDEYQNVLKKFVSGINGFTDTDLEEVSKIKGLPTTRWLLSHDDFRSFFNKIESYEEKIMLDDPAVCISRLRLPRNDGKEGERKKLVGGTYFLENILSIIAVHECHKSSGGISIPVKPLRQETAVLARKLLKKIDGGIEHIYPGNFYELSRALNQLVFTCEVEDRPPIFASSNKLTDRKWLGYRLWIFFSSRYGEDMSKGISIIIRLILDDAELEDSTVRRYIREWKKAIEEEERMNKHRLLASAMVQSVNEGGKQ